MATNYVWNPLEDNIMAEYDDQGNVIVEYTTEPTLHGNVISQFRNGQTSYFHHDGNGNTIAVTNDNGDVTDTRAYNAFGEITESTGTTEFPFQFVGQKGYYRDKETGKYSVRRRPYEPVIARWQSVDPGRFTDDRVNLYKYSHNRPISWHDPNRLQAVADFDVCCWRYSETWVNNQTPGFTPIKETIKCTTIPMDCCLKKFGKVDYCNSELGACSKPIKPIGQVECPPKCKRLLGKSECFDSRKLWTEDNIGDCYARTRACNTEGIPPNFNVNIPNCKAACFICREFHNDICLTLYADAINRALCQAKAAKAHLECEGLC